MFKNIENLEILTVILFGDSQSNKQGSNDLLFGNCWTTNCLNHIYMTEKELRMNHSNKTNTHSFSHVYLLIQRWTIFAPSAYFLTSFSLLPRIASVLLRRIRNGLLEREKKKTLPLQSVRCDPIRMSGGGNNRSTASASGHEIWNLDKFHNEQCANIGQTKCWLQYVMVPFLIWVKGEFEEFRGWLLLFGINRGWDWNSWKF